MSKLMTPRTKRQVAATSVTILRTAYTELADVYNQIVHNELFYCHTCGDWKRNTGFYTDNRTVSGFYPMCKECVMDLALDYDKKNHTYADNREKTIQVFQMLDLPFVETLYRNCLDDLQNDTSERKRATAFQSMLRIVKSFPQYKNMTFKDSEFLVSETESTQDEESVTKINTKILKNGRKRFGSGYSDEDYLFLENEYQDWVTRYECNTKAQEESFQRLSMKKLEIQKATLAGDSTDKLDATYQQWLSTANITPRQSAASGENNAQSFGTLIQKYEETRPLPEVDPELKDVDKIGLLIDVFFKGHLSKMFGLKNAFADIYERYMKKYTVQPPEYDEEQDSESIFNKVFGSLDD